MRSKARFGIALTLAGLLGAALIWMAIGGSLETYAGPASVKIDGETYRLNGVVATGSPADAGKLALTAEGVRFLVEDQDDPSKKVWVQYRGTVPDTFKDGREIVVVGKMDGDTFVGERNTLLTKCPSKFDAKKSPEHEAT
jgi:cytochrome c-type biogenesis protein CcmE